MPVTVVIGAQWGDEGKGKVVDWLAQKMDMVVRFNGGPNAGHTVINEAGEFKLHLIPAGIFNPGAVCVIGNGVAVDPQAVFEEMEMLEKRGVSCRNLRISKKAHLIMPWHTLLDGLQEKSRGDRAIGTTRRGIGPVFSDKSARFGLRVGDLLNKEKFRARVLEIWRQKKELFFQSSEDKYYFCLFPDLIAERCLRYAEKFLPYIADTEPIIWGAMDKNQRILLEGAQGTLLDIDFGTYPQVTSSVCTVAGACQGSGVPPSKVTEVIGVVKAYTTRVCEAAHPFPTEMPKSMANALRKRAGEFGATTGRARRIGWLDGVLLRYAARLNGFTSLAVTRLDNLAGMKELKICNGYELKNGEIAYATRPETQEGFAIDDLAAVKPIYVELSAWQKFPAGTKEYSDLPWEVQHYLLRMKNLSGVPVKFISTGPERNHMALCDGK